MKKNKNASANKNLSQQTKIKRTGLALIALTLIESIYILFGHRSSFLEVVLLLLVIALTTIIAWTWLEIKFETGGQKSMTFIKTLLFLAPVMFLTVILQHKYKDYNIRSNKRTARGVVVRTYGELSRIRFRNVTNYYADVSCSINGQPTQKTISINSINYFTVGDTVTIEYSKTDPELFYVRIN